SDEFGNIVYFGAQAKAKKVTGRAGSREGNVNELIDQVKKLFRTSFKSFIDNSEKKIGHAFIFTSQEITIDAKNQIFYEFENMSNISIVQIDAIVNSLLEHKMAEKIFDYAGRKKTYRKNNRPREKS
ncbi:MAG: hypothetical protein NWE79_05275, partial [Candidatus Bathyarchaeota archaeon]|nr:hypothetical protein [Candidatus Bathyarchaeota archaeon]